MKYLGIIFLALYIIGCKNNNTAKKNDDFMPKNKVEADEIIPKADTFTGEKSYSSSDENLPKRKSRFFVNDKDYRYVYLYENDKLIKKFELPKDIKNLGFESISETKKGFNIIFTSGGFSCSHENEFVFEKKNKKIYLTKIKTKKYLNYENKILRDSIILTPPVLLNKVKLKDIYKQHNTL
jgi:hypothetical protein